MEERPVRIARTLLLGVSAAALLACTTAEAQHRGHPHRHGGASVRFGVYVGVPYGYPWYPPVRYYYYPAYYPPVVVAPAPPPVYIEQAPQVVPVPQAAPATPAVNWWYFCGESQAYYPYVRECAGGWQKVPPQPPAG